MRERPLILLLTLVLAGLPATEVRAEEARVDWHKVQSRLAERLEIEDIGAIARALAADDSNSLETRLKRFPVFVRPRNRCPPKPPRNRCHPPCPPPETGATLPAPPDSGATPEVVGGRQMAEALLKVEEAHQLETVATPGHENAEDEPDYNEEA